MTILRQVTAALLFLTATIIAPTISADAAGAAPQTILNPATVKKTSYPKIVIFTVAWCPHCRELKEYLTSRNIPFINRDVELDTAAMQELVNKYNSHGVPVVVIGNNQEVLKGFTAEQFEALVEKVRSDSK